MSGPVTDLDAIAGEFDARVVKLGGREWELPGELPLVALEHFINGRISDFCRVLIGDDADEFAALLDGPRLEVILKDVYGLAPEGGASAASSKSTSKRSRPTSKRTTA
jgi:hypothetical protein